MTTRLPSLAWALLRAKQFRPNVGRAALGRHRSTILWHHDAELRAAGQPGAAVLT